MFYVIFLISSFILLLPNGKVKCNNDVVLNLCQIRLKNVYAYTVKPVYNGHPWDLKKVAVRQGCLIKLRF